MKYYFPFSVREMERLVSLWLLAVTSVLYSCYSKVLLLLSSNRVFIKVRFANSIANCCVVLNLWHKNIEPPVDIKTRNGACITSILLILFPPKTFLANSCS